MQPVHLTRRDVVHAHELIAAAHRIVNFAVIKDGSLAVDVPLQQKAHWYVASFCARILDLQRDPGGLVQGFVDLDFGCSTILLGQ